MRKRVLEYSFFPTERSTQYFGDHIGSDGIAAEDHERLRPPATIELDIGWPVTDCQTNQRAACREEHVGTGPQVLVDGEPNSPGLASDDPRYSGCQHRTRFLLWTAT